MTVSNCQVFKNTLLIFDQNWNCSSSCQEVGILEKGTAVTYSLPVYKNKVLCQNYNYSQTTIVNYYIKEQNSSGCDFWMLVVDPPASACQYLPQTGALKEKKF